MIGKDADAARGRAFHNDPRELILMAAEHSGLLKGDRRVDVFLE